MRVLVACEESGTVRDAFDRAGHEAWSCDLLATRRPMGKHIIGDALMVAYKRGPWDLMIAFPPCTHLAVSGARWFKHKLVEQYQAIEFALHLMDAPIPRISLENPIGVLSSSRLGKPTQIIQPWMFGHRETKATCLWLKNLPPLEPTNIVGPPQTPEEKREYAKVHRMPPSEFRSRDRSITYQGVAEAMVSQWGILPVLDTTER